MDKPLTRDERERYDIALARWRADMHDLAAAKYAEVGLPRDAARASERAGYFRAVADHVEAVRAERDDAGRIPGRTKRRIHTTWRELRERGAACQAIVFAETAIDFTEPTPAELGVI